METSELNERLRRIGSLVADMSPGSIDNLKRKTEALAHLRICVEENTETNYPLAVQEATKEIEYVFECGGQGHNWLRQRLNRLYQAGVNATTYPEPEPATACDDAAAYQIIGGRTNRLYVDSIRGQDDIEFFRSGGI